MRVTHICYAFFALPDGTHCAIVTIGPFYGLVHSRLPHGAPTMSETLPAKPKPRIIVELQDDGSIIIESYHQGSRFRDHVSRYFTGNAVLDALSHQKNLLDNAAEEKRIRQEREEAARHRRVWNNVAFGHSNNSRGFGIAFANKTVGVISRTPKEPKEPAAPVATLDLI